MVTRCRIALVGLSVAVLATAGTAAVERQDPVAWDARLEFVSLMFHLAGAPEYSTNKVPRYSAAVAGHFEQFKDHPAVAATREMRDKHRIAFFHPMNLAVHLTDPPALVPRIPLDQPGLAIGARWQAAPHGPYLERLRAFYRDARVGEFFEAQAALHDVATSRLRAVVSADVDEPWFRRYFGSGPTTRFKAVPSLLNGNLQIAATYRGQGVEEAYAIMGVYKIDAEGLPVFDRTDADNVVHEYVHTLTNAHVDAALPKLEAVGPSLFEKVQKEMRAQSYGTWQTMVYEQVVRAVVVRYIAAKRGDAEAETEIAAQERLGFTMTRGLSAVLADYERTRSSHPSFADVMPKIIAAFAPR